MKWRILFLSLGITLVCILVFSFASTQVYYNSSIDNGKEYLRVYMNEYDASKYAPDNEGASEFSKALNGTRVTFMNGQGDVIADSRTNEIQSNHSDRAEVKEAISHGEGYAVRNSSTLGENMIYYCKFFPDSDLLIRIAISTDSDWKIFAKTLPSIAEYLIIILAACVLLTFVATHYILNPVQQLVNDAAANSSVTSKYSELLPIAEVLNERNRNIERQMQEIKDEKELVEQTRKSKDEFISNVTHEMNTPLTSIHGYAELLDTCNLSEEQKKTAYKTILTQSERLTNLIACIINYSEIDNDELPPYEVNVSSIVRETLYALKPEADKRNIELIENVTDNVKLMSRHERISEIVGNLVRNAIKYNKDGGKIIVTLNYQMLRVEDTGIGIAQENLDKVFSRFFTVDKSHNGKNGGFGLGLAVVKKICNKSGWKIGVESTLGVGSKFTIEF